jgi:hypothetical protein
VIVTPTNNEIIDDTTPLIEWTIAYGNPAPTYTLEIATDAAFEEIVYTAADLTALSHVVSSTLDQAKHYFRVTAYNALVPEGRVSSAITATITILPEGYEPTDEAELVGWWDARYGLWQDTAGTIPAVSGQKIARWDDQSGAGRSAVQSNSVRQPTYAVTGLDGAQPELTWGNSIHLEVSDADALTPTTGMTAYVLHRISTYHPDPQSLLCKLSEYQMYLQASRVYGTVNSVGHYSSSSTGVHLGRLRWDGAVVYVKADGSTEQSTAQSTAPTNSANKLMIGARDVGSQNLLSGGIALILLFSGHLSAEARARVEAWIAQEFGINL